MRTINVKKMVGTFAENKDLARDMRKKILIPELEAGREVTIDFTGVDSATQSFVHALISEVIRKFGPDVLDKIMFKSCNESVRGIINIVVDYMQV